MSLTLPSVAVPDFGTPFHRPAIPAQTYENRCAAAFAASGTDWLVVYGDREHFANLAFLTGFDPRFEEALLLLGPAGQRIVVSGNENQGYTPIAGLPGLTTVLCQSLSLMGQDRILKPDLMDVLLECGVKLGDSVGLAGWKYLEEGEWRLPAATFFAPAYVVDSIRAAVGSSGSVVDAARILLHPTTGLRAIVDADAIAESEWGAARASLAVWRIITGFVPGDSELLAASRMGYAGEPMTCHPMLASGGPLEAIIGLRSPTARVPAVGDGAVTAIGYWGGLTARGGLLAEQDDAFLAVAKGYFEGHIAWYETANIGVEGGAVHDAVVSKLASGGLKPALNPGHLTGHDEWLHSPIRPGSTERIASGMAFQVDIIPVPMCDGWALNCEDPVTIADEALRSQLREKHPSVFERCQARRTFVRDELGIPVRDNVLLLSAVPLCLPVFWMKPDRLLAKT
jgi:hypothetical protein